MSNRRGLRYGIWALVYGSAGVRHHPDEPLDASWDRISRQVLEAEALGYDSVLVAQHTISTRGEHDDHAEAWSTASALAALTDRIEIIAAIKPYLYHPVFLAKMALQIEEISRGRFAINFVNAFNKPEVENAGLVFPDHDERYAYGREWLDIVRQLWSGGVESFDGKYFSVRDYRLLPQDKFRSRPVIYMGGESAPGKALVNDMADIWFLNAVPEEVAAGHIADMRSRRRLGSPLRFGIPPFVVARETDAAADDELALLLELANAPGERWAASVGRVDPKATMGGSSSDGRRTTLGFRGGTNAGLTGSYDTVARKILRFNELGVELFMLSFQPFEEEMRRFAHEVMPRVERLSRLSV